MLSLEYCRPQKLVPVSPCMAESFGECSASFLAVELKYLIHMPEVNWCDEQKSDKKITSFHRERMRAFSTAAASSAQVFLFHTDPRPHLHRRPPLPPRRWRISSRHTDTQ